MQERGGMNCDKRTERVQEGEPECVLERMDERDALLSQQHGHPGGKSVYRDGLEDIEEYEHHCPGNIVMTPNLAPPANRKDLVAPGLRQGQIAAEACPNCLFHPGSSNFGFLRPAVSGVPAPGLPQLRLDETK